MLTKTLAATAALSMLVGGGAALAQSKSAVAGPKQPIPYAKLDAYLKASPKARASKDWWSGSASAATGMSTDTSATAPGMNSGMMSGSSMTPSTPADTSVNPPAMPSTPPTYGGTQPNGSTLPNPTTPGGMTSSSTTPPTGPK